MLCITYLHYLFTQSQYYMLRIGTIASGTRPTTCLAPLATPLSGTVRTHHSRHAALARTADALRLGRAPSNPVTCSAHPVARRATCAPGAWCLPSRRVCMLVCRACAQMGPGRAALDCRAVRHVSTALCGACRWSPDGLRVASGSMDCTYARPAIPLRTEALARSATHAWPIILRTGSQAADMGCEDWIVYS
jgi:hypothetical protein